MFSILIKEEQNCPIVVNHNDILYPEYLDSGYDTVFSGTKKDCYEILSEMINAYAD